MRNTFKRTALSLAMGAGLIGSTAVQACPMEPLISSVCVMALSSSWGDFGGGMYALADGRLLPIQQNAALYSLVGTTYGGNGSTTFGIPDLRGRVVVGSGVAPGIGTFNPGQMGGAASVTLTANQLPTHAHALVNVPVNISQMTATTTLTGLSASLTGSLALKAATGGTTGSDPTGKTLATTAGTIKIYSDAAPTITMNAGSIDSTGLTVGNFTGTPATTLGGTATVSGNTAAAGGSQPVSTMMPYTVLRYYIALNGVYPQRD